MVNALTHKPGIKVRCLTTPATITNPLNEKSINILGIWDTGATDSVVTKSVARALGLEIVKMTKVSGVHGIKDVPVYYVTITLNNENIKITTLVTECEELSGDGSIGMLIGMNVITMGDLCITNQDNKGTVLTFRVPSLETIDYVAEISEYNHMLKVHKAMTKHGNELCPCGSRKKYEKCHGKSKYNH